MLRNNTVSPSAHTIVSGCGHGEHKREFPPRLLQHPTALSSAENPPQMSYTAPSHSLNFHSQLLFHSRGHRYHMNMIFQCVVAQWSSFLQASLLKCHGRCLWKHIFFCYFLNFIVTFYFHCESDGVLHIFKVLIQITSLVSLIMFLLGPWRDAVIFVVIWA